MKVRIIQPAYTFEPNDLQQNFDAMIALMEQCNEPLDIIVMPEYCDIPAAQKGKQAYRSAIEKYNKPFMEKAIEMAKRCHAITFVNCAYETPDGKLRNTTHAIDRDGNIVGRYYKAHPAPKEDKPESVGGLEMDSSYSFNGKSPYVLELEGIRFAFMTCYDFYMYEEFPQIARKNVDVVIGCSHQRTDTHQALEIINRFLCYNTNAYLIRASVSLGEDSPIGGCSCVIAPNGDVLADMKSRAGFETVEIDVTKKYYKAAGFGGVGKAPKPHYEYIEEGRRPWIYRNGGASVVQTDRWMPYPRICAHRGFNTVAPENSMPAFGAAIALGAEEIEFDLRLTKDNVLVSCHDRLLDRVSDGSGKISDYTYEELLQFDFGAKWGGKYKGLKIVKFEDILKKFAGRVIMNIHVKLWDRDDSGIMMEEIVELIRQYDCEKYCYIVSRNDETLKRIKEYAPNIGICVGAGKTPWQIVDRGIAIGADKVQLFKPHFNQEMIDKAHANGIRCNVFFADNPEEAIRYLDMGADTILTNDYLSIYNAVKDRLGNK
ncbi:MAG: hypothetical protein IKA82_00625 [Clostridia bacterium]|nr:hypothetical protein [Clostridia bacterium]